MGRQARFLRLLEIVTLTLLAAACGDAVSPAARTVEGPVFSHTGGDPALDQQNGTLATFPTGSAVIAKGFNPTNPHRGSAVMATFVWVGTTNIITSVTDRLANNTPVGNTYHLVEYVTAGGISMATYLATNVQGFPDPNLNPDGSCCDQDQVYVVEAFLAVPIMEGGVMISAYAGIAPDLADALGEHRSASGSGNTSPATAAPGPVAAAAGTLVYGVSLATPPVGREPPPGFAPVGSGSAALLADDGVWTLQATDGAVNPQWTWFFGPAPGTWLATALVLKPAAAAPVPGPISADLSSVTASPLTIAASTESSIITVTVRDTDGNPIPGATVELFATGSGNALTQPSGPTDANGVVTGVFSSTEAESKTVSASANGVVITQTATVTVTSQPPNSAPVVDAGPDETALTGVRYVLTWSFSDADNGPWSYTVDWGDGTTTSGSKTFSPDTCFDAHTYDVLLPKSFTIQVTVVDSQGAVGWDTKVVTVM